MDHRTQLPPRRRAVSVLAVGFALALAACSPASSSPGSDGGGSSEGGAPSTQAPAPNGGSGSGEDGVEGSLTTSGVYDATWTWQPGNNLMVGDIGSITLNSDHDTFGSITVKTDGSIDFGSTAPELPVLYYAGTGAQVTLDTVNIGYVCSFTLDNDLTGSDGSVLHIAGTMTIHIAEGVTPC